MPAHGYLAHSVIRFLLESNLGADGGFHVVDQGEVVLALLVIRELLGHADHALVHLANGFHPGTDARSRPRVGKQSESQVFVGDSWIAHEGSFDKGP